MDTTELRDLADVLRTRDPVMALCDAAEEIERLCAELQLLQVVAGTLATHVRGHFVMASATSPTICQEWAEKVQDTIAAQERK